MLYATTNTIDATQQLESLIDDMGDFNAYLINLEYTPLKRLKIDFSNHIEPLYLNAENEQPYEFLKAGTLDHIIELLTQQLDDYDLDQALSYLEYVIDDLYELDYYPQYYEDYEDAGELIEHLKPLD